MNKKRLLTLRNSFIRSEKGFSLIEAAIGLIVLGFIAQGFMHANKVWLMQISHDNTEGKMALIQNAMNQYYMNGNAHYPCPSSLIAGEGSANFGMAANCDAANFVNIKLCSNADWKTTDGYCKTSDDVAAVIIGAVPFESLKISYGDTLDYWDNKILYAVTFQKTSKDTFEAQSGSVRVITMDDSSDTFLDQIPDEKTFTDAPDFFLVSAGVNKVGAFTKDGKLVKECGDELDGYEMQNCDFDEVFFASNDPDVANTGAQSLVEGANYYDDITLYQIKVGSNTWFPSPDFPDHVMTLSQHVGIGTANPQYALHVAGNIKAPGEVKAKVFCDNTMTNCFDPELITGNKEEMHCGSEAYGDQGLLRMAENRFFCNSGVDLLTGEPLDGDGLELDTAVFKPKDCSATGQLVVGIDETGTVICADP